MKTRRPYDPFGAAPSGERVVALTAREIATLRRAQAIASELRNRLAAHIGPDVDGSELDMTCAQIEHGVTELLDEHQQDGEISLE